MYSLSINCIYSYLLKLNIPWPLVIGFCCPVKTQYVIRTRFKSLIRLHLCSQRRILHIIAWAMKMKFFSVLNMTVIILLLHQWTACNQQKKLILFQLDSSVLTPRGDEHFWAHPCVLWLISFSLMHVHLYIFSHMSARALRKHFFASRS